MNKFIWIFLFVFFMNSAFAETKYIVFINTNDAKEEIRYTLEAVNKRRNNGEKVKLMVVPGGILSDNDEKNIDEFYSNVDKNVKEEYQQQELYSEKIREFYTAFTKKIGGEEKLHEVTENCHGFDYFIKYSDIDKSFSGNDINEIRKEECVKKILQDFPEFVKNLDELEKIQNDFSSKYLTEENFKVKTVTNNSVKNAIKSIRKTDPSAVIDSIAVSGHDGSGEISGTYGSFNILEMDQITKSDPKLADEVKTIVTAACYVGTQEKAALIRGIFPNIKLNAGYNLAAPAKCRKKGRTYIRDSLIAGSELSNTSESQEFKKAIQSYTHQGELWGATTYFYPSACELDKEDKSYSFELAGSGFKENNKDCTKAYLEFPKIKKTIMDIYLGKVPVPETPSSEPLSSTYQKLQNYKHCYQSHEYYLPNPAIVVQLRFYEEFKDNAGKYFNDDMNKLKILKELDKDDWKELAKLNVDNFQRKYDYAIEFSRVYQDNRFETDVNKIDELINKHQPFIENRMKTTEEDILRIEEKRKKLTVGSVEERSLSKIISELYELTYLDRSFLDQVEFRKDNREINPFDNFHVDSLLYEAKETLDVAKRNVNTIENELPKLIEKMKIPNEKFMSELEGPKNGENRPTMRRQILENAHLLQKIDGYLNGISLDVSDEKFKGLLDVSRSISLYQDHIVNMNNIPLNWHEKRSLHELHPIPENDPQVPFFINLENQSLGLESCDVSGRHSTLPDSENDNTTYFGPGTSAQ